MAAQHGGAPAPGGPGYVPDGGAGPDDDRQAVGVLADRLAAALVHHEPGWRLPRHSALARRYNVSTAEIEAALAELIGRHLVRRLADGQLYRASPAEYLINLPGVPGLDSTVDAMGAELACRSRQVSWRQAPEDVTWALGLPAGEPVCVVRFLWTAGGEPAAFSTTYLASGPVGPERAEPAAVLPQELSLLPLTSADTGLDGHRLLGRPGALHVELQAPPPSVARSLRLTAGQPATLITVRFDDPQDGSPVALSVAVLRPDLFRIVVRSPAAPLPEAAGTFAGAWTHAVGDWEP